MGKQKVKAIKTYMQECKQWTPIGQLEPSREMKKGSSSVKQITGNSKMG